jgi:replication factor C subunit 3/5
MSDYEDDMDVDTAPSKDKSIRFSGDGNTGKQKRIVADLPIEAEDNLPWYDAWIMLEIRVLIIVAG